MSAKDRWPSAPTGRTERSVACVAFAATAASFDDSFPAGPEMFLESSWAIPPEQWTVLAGPDARLALPVASSTSQVTWPAARSGSGAGMMAPESTGREPRGSSSTDAARTHSSIAAPGRMGVSWMT